MKKIFSLSALALFSSTAILCAMVGETPRTTRMALKPTLLILKEEQEAAEVKAALRKARAQTDDDTRGMALMRKSESDLLKFKEESIKRIQQEKLAKEVGDMAVRIGIGFKNSRFAPAEEDVLRKAIEEFAQIYFYDKPGLCRVGNVREGEVTTPSQLAGSLSLGSKKFKEVLEHLEKALKKNDKFLARNKSITAEPEGAPAEKHNYRAFTFPCLGRGKLSKSLSDRTTEILTPERGDKIEALFQIPPFSKVLPHVKYSAKSGVADLINKDSGFVIIPSPAETRDHAFVKVQVGKHRTPQYRFYTGTLIKNYHDSDDYNNFARTHTLVTLESNLELIFAIPNEGRMGTIFSLSTYNLLLGREHIELLNIARLIWNEERPPVAVLKPSISLLTETSVAKPPKPTGKEEGITPIDLEELIKTSGVSGTYKALREAKNEASDGELIGYILGSTVWDKLSPDEKTSIVLKVTGKPKQVDLDKLISESKIIETYISLRAQGNWAPDRDLISYLLGDGVWKKLTPAEQVDIVFKITGKPKPTDLDKIISESKIIEKYISVRAQGNGASDKDLIAYLVGDGVWEKLTPGEQAEVIAKVVKTDSIA